MGPAGLEAVLYLELLLCASMRLCFMCVNLHNVRKGCTYLSAPSCKVPQLENVIATAFFFQEHPSHFCTSSTQGSKCALFLKPRDTSKQEVRMNYIHPES